jgi:hypothetical protein
VENRLLILSPDPVFDDATLDGVQAIGGTELKIVRNLGEAVSLLLAEHFDGLVVEGEASIAIEMSTNARQHFPSLKLLCVAWTRPARDDLRNAAQQKIQVVLRDRTLSRHLARFLDSLGGRQTQVAAEGIDPCHSLIGNLNQFSAAEILQMSCLAQRSGRFTFKSGRGTSEIYLHYGSIRHAVYGDLFGEAAVAEIFRWRQGRFYFEEGILSQHETVDRPWAHLLIDNLQKLDETMDLASMN